MAKKPPAVTSVVLLILCFGAPGSALAAGASVKAFGCAPHGCAYTVAYAAANGESNQLVISGTHDAVTFSDSGARVDPGAGCTAADIHTVVCKESEGLLDAEVGLGDGDDTGDSFAALGVQMDGGPGADVLRAHADFGATLLGGGGRDTLAGGPGPDTLADGDGLLGAPIDSDSLDGGPGRDTVSYATRKAAIRFDPATGPVAGQQGEADQVRSVENGIGGAGGDVLIGGQEGAFLAGGAGADRIAGGAGSDSLDAGAGDDSVVAGAGDDVVQPGSGADRVSAGSGDDRILPDSIGGELDRGRDSLHCGGGIDSVTRVTAVDFVGDDCESIFPLNLFALDFGPLRSGLPLKSLSSPIIRFDLPCRRGPCAVVMTARLVPRSASPAHAQMTLLARRRLLASRSSPGIALRLSRTGRAILRLHPTLRIQVAVCERFGRRLRARPCASYTTVLRRP